MKIYKYSVELATPIPLAQKTLKQREGLLFQGDKGHWSEAAPLPFYDSEDFGQLCQNLSGCFYEWARDSLNWLETSQRNPLPPLSSATLYHPEKDLDPLTKILKVKVGQKSLIEDRKLIERLMTEYPKAQFRLDANFLLRKEEAKELRELCGERLDFFEDPYPKFWMDLSYLDCLQGLDQNWPDISWTEMLTLLQEKFIIPVIKPAHISFPQLLDLCQREIPLIFSTPYTSEVTLELFQNLSFEFPYLTSLHHGLDTLNVFSKEDLPLKNQAVLFKSNHGTLDV